MGVFDKIFRRSVQPVKDTRTIPGVPWWIGTGQGVEEVTDAGAAMKISAVYRCVDILSKGVAQLPLEVRVNRGGYYTPDEASDLNYLLSVRPNSRYTAFEFFRNLVAQMVTKGNAYVLPTGDISNPSELILLTPGSCFYDEVANKYNVNDNVNGIAGTYTADEILHFRNISTYGYTGISTISYAATVLAIQANADRQNVTSYKDGGSIKGIVSGQNATIGFGAVQDDQLTAVAENLDKQFATGKRVAVLPGEMKFTQMSFSPNDMQLLQTKEFTVIEICRFFGVHPDKVFAQQNANYKASEMSQVAFLTDTLQPYLRQIEMEFQTKLISRSNYGKYRIEFNIEPLMQTDLTTQAAYMEKTIATGTRTVNSWRKKLGQEPVDGGDEVLVSANLLPIKSPKLWGDPQVGEKSVKNKK